MKKLALIFAIASLTACGGASETSTEETTMEDSTMVEEVMEEPADTTEMVSPEEKEIEDISTPMDDSTMVDSSMEEM